MRRARWCHLALAGAACGAACGDRPLSAGAGAAAAAAADAGTLPVLDGGAADTGPARGSISWAIPAGIVDPAGGSTTLGPVVALTDGGFFVAGTFTGAVLFAPDKLLIASGPRDAFVARYRADQRLVWVRPFTGAGEVFVSGAAALDGDEAVVAGWFSGVLAMGRTAPGDPARVLSSAGRLDGFVARVAADGSVRWAVRAGAADDDIVRGVAAAGNQVAVTGAVGRAAVLGPGERNETVVPPGEGPILAALLDARDGTLTWADFPGGGVPSQGYGVAVDDGGRVVVTGYVNGPAAFGAGVVVDPGVGRAFAARWGSTGGLAWVRPMAGPAGEGDTVAIGGDTGLVVVAGTFEDEARFVTPTSTIALVSDRATQPACFLAVLSPADGSALWARRFAGRGVRPWRVRFAAGGDLLIAASFGGRTVLDPDGPRPLSLAAAANDDALFARLGGDGALRWAATVGGPGDDEAADVVEAADGFVLATGRYVGPVTVGAGAAAVTLTSGTDGAAFVLRLWP